MSDYGSERTLRACEVSLRKLGLDYLDLYLLHWPVPSDFDATVAAYRAAETLLAEGRVRAIGVSNFSAKHLERLLEGTEVIPAANQVELHPFFIQRDLRAAHQRLGIVTQSWSPIGGVYHRNPSAIPKSVRPERIAENIDLFDFVLSKDELAAIDGLDTGVRAGANPETVDSKTWPIKIDD